MLQKLFFSFFEGFSTEKVVLKEHMKCVFFDDFVKTRFTTIDETWIHHYTPKPNQQAKQWVGPDGTASMRAKTQQWSGNVMASIFWKFSGTLFIYYLK